MAQHERGCIGTALIERLAAGEPATPAVAAHLGVCGACRARLEEAREDALFVDRVRGLAGEDLGPEGAPRIPGYRILEVVSSGSQGVVFRAVQESTARVVAVKLLLAGEEMTARQRVRAEREAEIAARMRHPNIVSVYESRTLADGNIVVVMEFVDGVALDAWTAPGATPADRQRALLEVFASVCRAIHHAHLNGVIHRDLKPENVLVTAEGRPVVLDFGIAKAGDMRTTLTGEFAGTPAYASPEQVSGKPSEVDALTDVYSLGVILYRLLCREMPYPVEGSILDVARTITEVEPTPLRWRNPGVSADLEAIALRALRKDKTKRYQSAASLARDIERVLGGEPVEARSGSGWYVLRKALVMNRQRLAWSGVFAAALLAAAAMVVVSMARASRAAEREARERINAREESVRARAVTELLRETLPTGDGPAQAPGGPLDMGLARLFFRLETGSFADEPEVDQAVRRLWGGVYTGFGSGRTAGLVEYAELSLRLGLVRLRMERPGDGPETASAMHELSGVLLVRKRLAESEAMCREALAMRERLFGEGAPVCGASRALLARIFREEGKAEEAVAEARRARVIFGSHPDHAEPLLEASMFALEGRIAFDGGDFEGSEPLLRQALALRLRTLPPEDADLLASLVDAAEFARVRPTSGLAMLIGGAWNCPASEAPAMVAMDLPLLRTPSPAYFDERSRRGRQEPLGRLLRLQEAILGPEDHALVGTLIAIMRASNGNAALEQRWRAAARAADVLARRFGEHDLSVLGCLEQAANTLAFTGQPERAIGLGQRALGIWESKPAAARDGLLEANCRRRLAWYHALSGEHERATPLYEAAIEQLLGLVGERHHSVALAESGLALSLGELGDLDQAEALTARALETARRSPATPGDALAHILAARGHVLARQGRWTESAPALAEAWGVYRSTAPEFRWRRMMIGDMVAAREALGDPGGATAWREQIDRDPGDAAPGAPGQADGAASAGDNK